MERKLAEFRARRRGENAHNNMDQIAKSNTDTTTADSPPKKVAKEHSLGQDPQIEGGSDWLLDSTLGRWLASKKYVISSITFLKVLLWLVLLGMFAELEFGLPFFVVSLFYWLYEGLRSPAARKPGEMSAYSVFNPDCQPLLGALTAEQLEGEMGYRPLANR
uniref:SAYSvFN domain-containing protein 1 n=1 Tax=Doryrhamphus excisus TaxID=161450 RepID=UPI0025AE4DA1|nr:SAYSvFN domain-containing protein 1 [Doryrhamphus excisus]